ncbi:MAG: right-handed parallel beta-helix repeat-containing protein [Planctomycetia bacterium]|nr:right-handed parallel beta-helix repeat-containing protein [Planctomycetia bacterium]
MRRLLFVSLPLMIMLFVFGLFFVSPVQGQDECLEQLKILEQPLKADFFVSPDGNDKWSGTLAVPNTDRTDGPFKTPEKAKLAVRKLRKSKQWSGSPTVVELKGGNYELDASFRLYKNEDAGTQVAPIIYRAAKNETPCLLAGKYLNAIEPVQDQAFLAKLKPSVDRSKIFQVDLKAAGITQFGTPHDGVIPSLNGKPMTLARYPNEGNLMTITGFAPECTPHYKHVMAQELNHNKIMERTKKQGFFKTNDPEILTWKNEKDIWVFGYWFRNWAFCDHQVASIEPETMTIRVKEPFHDLGYWAGQMFFAFNLISELDAPGEFYIDRDAGLLYFYADQKPEKDSLFLAIHEYAAVSYTSHIIFQGLTFAGATGKGLILPTADDVKIVGCTFRNCGGTGARIVGSNILVFGCEFYKLGKGGISAVGGERQTLTPSHIAIVNNNFHDYEQQVAVTVNGVGIRIAHNHIHDAAANGISFGGNDHIIEYNKLHDIIKFSNDAGAIYCCGTWTSRGNVIRYNDLRNIHGLDVKRGTNAIYIDGVFSSVDIVGNLIVDIAGGIRVSGGHDNKVINNYIIDSKRNITVMPAFVPGWKYLADRMLDAHKKNNGVVEGVKWQAPPFSTRYPEMAKMIVDPYVPLGNVMSRNLITKVHWDEKANGEWTPFKQSRYLDAFLELRANKAKGIVTSGLWKGMNMDTQGHWLTFENNFLGGDPHFVNAAKDDFRLKADSPALKLGIEQLPFDKMGPFIHPLCAPAIQ